MNHRKLKERSVNFLHLLDKSMKDDDVIEVLEHYDISVIYDFDRSHENMDDLYWAPAKQQGFQFRFNKSQILDVVFLYMIAREGFMPIDRTHVDVAIFESFDEALSACCSNSVSYKACSSEPGSATYKWWIKLDFGTYTVHYQFREGQLIMITLGSKSGV